MGEIAFMPRFDVSFDLVVKAWLIQFSVYVGFNLVMKTRLVQLSVNVSLDLVVKTRFVVTELA